MGTRALQMAASGLTATTFVAEGLFTSLESGESLAVCIGVAPPALLSLQCEAREGVAALSSVPQGLPSNFAAKYRYAVVSKEGRVLVRRPLSLLACAASSGPLPPFFYHPVPTASPFPSARAPR